MPVKGVGFPMPVREIHIMEMYDHARIRTRFLAALAVRSALILLAASPSWAESLTLDEALSRVARAGPLIAISAAQRQAAEASVRQAGARPRDVIGVDVEDFGGSGSYSAVERSQTTGWYERTWERGGKREARIGSARSDVVITEQRGRLRMLDVLERVQASWAEAVVAEAAVDLAKERLALATRLEQEVGRRVQRALDPLFARERARTAVAQARITHDQSVETARIARASLAAWWGGGADYPLEKTDFTFFSTSPPAGPDFADLALLEAERSAAQAKVNLAQANDVTDPTLRAGVRHFGQGNDVALMIGGSIPIGGRQANRANIERAQAERLSAEAELALGRTERQRELDQLLAQRGTITIEINRIDSEVLPSAKRAVALVRNGFSRGGTAFTFLEVDQAQQIVIDARTRRIELLRQYHLLSGRLDRLIGRHVHLLTSAEKR